MVDPLNEGAFAEQQAIERALLLGRSFGLPDIVTSGSRESAIVRRVLAQHPVEFDSQYEPRFNEHARRVLSILDEELRFGRFDDFFVGIRELEATVDSLELDDMEYGREWGKPLATWALEQVAAFIDEHPHGVG